MSAKSFFLGLTAGLAAGVVAQVLVSKNQEELSEMLKNLPSGLTLDELMEQKGKLEEVIKAKSEDLRQFAKDKAQKATSSDEDSDEEPAAV